MKLRGWAAGSLGALISVLSVAQPLGEGAQAQRRHEAGVQGPVSLQTPLVRQRRASGQNVAPVFEGWEPNPDETFSLYFGYMNRNWEEALDIPIGANNFFEPAPQDRGQPTHFLPRRGKRAFAIVVPKDFGDAMLVWTLSSRGKTERVPGSLKPLYQLTASREPRSGNTPPTLEAGPDQTIVLPHPATVRATVSDDGIGAGEGRPPHLTVEWRKYRGPGTVTFSSTTPAVAPDPRRLPLPPPDVLITDGQGVVTATFSEPGVYVLEVLADDGSMFDGGLGAGVPGHHCCWTTALVTITVKPGPTPVSQR